MTRVAGHGVPIGRRRMIVRALLHPVVLLPLLGALLFVPAGDPDGPVGWAVLVVYLTGLCLFSLLVILHDPELAKERVNPPAGTKSWDRTLTNLAILPILFMLPVAGLGGTAGHLHWPWSSKWPPWLVLPWPSSLSRGR